MEEFVWTDRLNTGIEEIDRQHRELFKRIDRLALALYEGKGRDELRGLIDYLSGYVKEHFRAEEDLMAASNFAGLSRHREKHRAFTDLFVDIVAEFTKRGGGNYLAIRVEKELRSWWENHITRMDMEYVPAARKKEGPK